jgi:hypothetical protein
MMASAAAQPSGSLAHGSVALKSAAVVGLAGLGDWLFYGRVVGVSAAMFIVVLGAAVAAVNPVCRSAREVLSAAAVLMAGVLPIMLEPNAIGFLSGALGVASFASVVMLGGGARSLQRIGNAILLLIDGSWRAASDLYRLGKWWSRRRHAILRTGSLVAWIVPAALGAVFLLLFVAANPLIESWIAAINPQPLLERISVGRVAFWLVAAALVWPFIFLRRRNRLQDRALAQLRSVRMDVLPAGVPEQLFGKTAILRSLVLFNVLFAIPTLLDVAYLWGGVALPEGVTHAAYAHRGAYPLVVTALLAAVFVIVATRPGTAAEGSPLIRNLVFLWTAQNVALVISSVLRLNLYVEAYSLTYWRVAAFIWMLLVGIGLVLIVARAALHRSNVWLIGANVCALGLTLYLSSFVNFAALIADYNVRHSRELSGAGALLDVDYLIGLGPNAIPALDRYLAHRRNEAVASLISRREELAAVHLTRQEDWRAWSYRRRQLTQYLRTTGARVIPAP